MVGAKFGKRTREKEIEKTWKKVKKVLDNLRVPCYYIEALARQGLRNAEASRLYLEN